MNQDRHPNRRRRIADYARKRLRFKAKLYAAFAILTAVIIGSSVLSYHGTERLNYHLERSRLAHEVHASFLNVSSLTYQLFKQFADALIIGDLDKGAGEAALLEALFAEFDILRRLTASEVDHVGDNEPEVEDLLAIARIERKVDEILYEYKEIQSLRADGNILAAETRLKALLDMHIDSEFNMMIEAAVAEEAREVAQADAAFTALALQLEFWTAVLAFIAVPVALFMLFTLTQGFRSAIRQLTLGAEAYAQGRLDYRIPELNDADFEIIAKRFNRMASELLANGAAMTAAHEALETTVKERTAELQNANERLQETDGARRRLFADISHELRTPLTVIRGEAEIALRGGDKESEEYKTSLMRIVEQAGLTARLVDDLLFIARSDAGQPRLDMRSVSIVGLVEATARDHETIAREKSVTIECLFNVKDAVVVGDQGRLRQVFSILIDNAIRYSLPHGSLRIRIDKGVHGLVVAVEDDGIGIAESDLEKVFDRFYRGDNAIRHAKGSGLGLPVAKAIVEAHKGSIHLSGKTGEGAVATVILPVEKGLQVVA